MTSRLVTGRGRRPARVGLVGLGSMGRNHLRILSSLAGRPARRGRRSGPRGARGGHGRRPAPRASPSRWRCSPRPTSTPSSSPSPTTTHLALALAAIERGIADARREAARGDARGGGRRSSTRRARDRRAGPGRPRRAVQPGRARARPAARRGLAVDGLRDREPAGRPVPGPHPRRRRDRRPRHARRRHPVAGSPASGRSGSPPRPPSGSTPTTRTCCSGCCRSRPGPVGDARRRLADAGQAPPAGRRRRGGHVRARLPDASA